MELSIIILAAGQGKRMHSKLPKVLQPLAGMSLLERVIKTAMQLRPQEIFVVYGNGGDHVKESMAHLPVRWVEQQERLGTGHAVSQVLPYINPQHQVMVLFGDVPLISKTTLENLLQKTPVNGLGIITVELDHPSGYGRILRNQNNEITAIIEHKDATPEQLAINEINTGILTTTAKNLQKWLPQIKNQNNQGEYYLTDIIAMAVVDHCAVNNVSAHPVEEVQGVNNHLELANLERYYQISTAKKLLLEGLDLVDPARFDLRGELTFKHDVMIDINVILEGNINLGANVKIGPNSVLRNVTVGDDVEIKANCVIEDAIIETGCIIGPFARIRPQTHLGPNVHIGNFVELKKTSMGEGSKANHLAYVGDAVIGKRVNVGAGVITCNYDGINKYVTIIEDGAFIGSDSQLVAPVTIGAGAYIGAGSTISKDAPAEKLTLSRSSQVTIPSWKPPSKKEK